MTFRHGGDFEGLRQRLYYIKGLGCNAVWVSPIFQSLVCNSGKGLKLLIFGIVRDKCVSLSD